MFRYLLMLLMIVIPGTHMAAAETDEREFRDMPVIVYYCDHDPGRIEAGGGKGPAPESLVIDGICTPAEGVSVTFVLANDDWDFETDDLAENIEWDVDEDSWFARCDIDAEGKCALNSPVGFDIIIGVVLHENTVKPGYEPAFFQSATHNFTEFAGWGLALVPTDENATPDTDPADHQTVALNIVHNDEPGNVLTEWVFNEDEDEDIYLATNTDGWVSNIVSADDELEIELVNIDDDADVSAACVTTTRPAETVDVDVVDGNNIVLSIPETEDDIRCDIVITD